MTPTPPSCPAGVAALLDHAILHPTTTAAQMRDEVERTATLGLASLCVRPADVAAATAQAAGRVAIGTVIGFPHGTTSTAAKVAEATHAIADGASELDMVIHPGAAVGGEWDRVRADIAAVLGAARAGGALLKVIFETNYLTRDADKVKLCQTCGDLGVDFVKTSTGFGYVKDAAGAASCPGATDHDVALLRRHCPVGVGVKASGGVRRLDDVLRFVQLGASRLGTASAPAILAEANERWCGGEAPAASPLAADRGQRDY